MATQIDYKRKSLESMIESLQCFKCKDVPGFKKYQRNRYSCVEESHQLCEKCKSRCECGSLVVKRPNPPTKQMLEDLPVYCPHYKNGCRELFLQVESLDDHQEGCVFRPVYCPDPCCQKKMLFNDVIDHFKQKGHEDFFWNDATENKCAENFLINEMVCNEPSAWWPRPIKIASGISFFLIGEVGNKIAYFWLYVMASPLEAKRYAYTLSVTGKNGKMFSCYDFAKPLDKRSDDIIDDQSVLIIGTKIIKELRNEKDMLEIEVTIHDLKEEAKDDGKESGVEDESD